MNNLNSILIEGNLVRDPRQRTTQSGKTVCLLTLASNRYYRAEDVLEKEVSFFDIETYGKLAEACFARGRKGKGLRVVGRIRQYRWNDDEGKPRSRIVIVAEHVEFRPEFGKGKYEPTLDCYSSEDDEEMPNISKTEVEEIVAAA